ncbi:hypothetical protein GPJ56_003166 [Histomonas meleagridis]|uniref:uncharacterized protein n=1 Tax=Histomonas meleagridis TaxID=135588 RepID=UPI00355A54CC|nr:hypothetical protein GPJ56_003166 [Histomonas meleagridis]KAH0801199.1 hypothetical protein GO595_005794 [Histomonas meleagridis]
MDFVEDPIFEPLLNVQSALQDLTPDTINNAFSTIFNFISKHPDHELAIVRFIYNIAETKYSCIDQFVELVKMLHFEDIVRRHLTNFGYSHNKLYFIQALIRAGLVPQSSYDDFLQRSTTLPEQFNEDYSHVYENHDATIARDLSSIIDKDDSDALQEYLTDHSLSVNTKFFTIPHFTTHSSPIDGDVSLIDYAAYRGMPKCFKYLFINKAELLTNDKTTSMTFAVSGGDNEIIHLIESQIKVRPTDIFGAIYNHRREVFDWILSNVDCKAKSLQENISRYCLLSDFYYGLKRMPAHIQISIDDMFSAIINQNNVEFMEIFLNKYGNQLSNVATRKNYRNKTMEICRTGNLEVFELYYDKYFAEIDVNIAFDDVILSRNIHFIKAFNEKYHPNINQRGFQGYTPIHRACSLSDFEIFEYFSEQENVDYNIPNDIHEDCLFTCCENGNTKILKKMLTNPSIDINRKHDSYEINALGCAIYKKNVEVVRILLSDPRIIPNIRTWYNAQHFDIKTSHLQIAINGSQEIMELLLENPKMKISLNEKENIIKKFPSLPKEIIENVKIRKEDRYDKLQSMYGEDDSYMYIYEEEEEDNDEDEDNSDSY